MTYNLFIATNIYYFPMHLPLFDIHSYKDLNYPVLSGRLAGGI